MIAAKRTIKLANALPMQYIHFDVDLLILLTFFLLPRLPVQLLRIKKKSCVNYE